MLSLLSAFVLAEYVPPSPHRNARCFNPANNVSVFANEYPSSNAVMFPFTEKFRTPSFAKPSLKSCRPDGHCVIGYQMDVYEKQLRIFDATIPKCKDYDATWFLTYNGTVPGPTLFATVGHESLVRFNNKMNCTYFKGTYTPCNEEGRFGGRPFSVHHHGSASLAPYDGWAEDETCPGESKDYIIPNNRPTTAWYHDHALHITRDNAYYGLAAHYWMSAKKSVGGCGAPWNLDNIPELPFTMVDKVLDNKCQLMNDGGYRYEPVQFPSTGLLIAVAERWDVVCDFSEYAGQTLYVYNGKDEQQMAGVPYFCHSHLLAKIQVDPVVPANAPKLDPTITSIVHTATHEKPLESIADAEIQTALQMARSGKAHRHFHFGRTNGQWTINGETWDTMRIAAADVGQNTWELWRLRTGGGWFHPIHVHLVDFFVIHRDGAHGLREFEYLSPKDVLYLGPSNVVYVMARFGAHKGDYMFHCHNLVHEDDDMMRAFRIVDSHKGLHASDASAEEFIVNPLNGLIYANYAYSDPLLGNVSAIDSTKAPAWNQAYIDRIRDVNAYRIFYPTPEDVALMNGTTNPWRAHVCPYVDNKW